ncbi:unnamed protein product, partial [Symbiodinium sp. KB8]
ELSAEDQARVRGALAALRADSCDEIAVLAAEAALCRSNGKVHVGSVLALLDPHVFRGACELLGDPANLERGLILQEMFMQHCMKGEPSQLVHDIAAGTSIPPFFMKESDWAAFARQHFGPALRAQTQHSLWERYTASMPDTLFQGLQSMSIRPVVWSEGTASSTSRRPRLGFQ